MLSPKPLMLKNMRNCSWIIILLISFTKSSTSSNHTSSLNPEYNGPIATIANISGFQSMSPAMSCLPGQYRCWDGTCIPQSAFCDDISDCGDNSDEFDYEFLKENVHQASVMSAILPCIPPKARVRHQESARPCALMNTWICDGIKGQCVDDIDEDCWSAPSSGCHSISSNLRCNGYNDCFDGSDEENCTRYECAIAEGTVLENQMCDGQFNCLDASDECLIGCNTGCYCPKVYRPCDGNKFCEVENPEHCVACLDLRSMYRLSQLCNGIDDCPDKSDEENCTKFECENGNKVWEALRCDTKDDCGDTSDECDCPHTFHCRNSNCISESKTCNGVNDCGDHSDECVRECAAKYRYTCANKECISAMSFCDGYDDCSDGSDEMISFTKNQSSSEIICNNVQNSVDKTCVLKQKTWVCDMSEHCEDRSDECQPGCNAQSFWCDDGTCLKVEAFCNGIQDCEDGSDERLYTGHTSEGAIPCVSKFYRHKECALGRRHPWICDIFTHCINRTDECTPGCPSSFTCQSGECINRAWLCDGDRDCSDGSDEQTTSGDVFQCVRTRHPITRVCHLPFSITKDNISDCDRSMDRINYHKMETMSNETEIFTKDSEVSVTHTYFHCLGESRFISGESRCDGTFNCPLLSDECLCENSPSICRHICYQSQSQDDAQSPCASCDIGEIQCGKKCINRLMVCDGVVDCDNGEDEEFCIPDTKCPQGKGKKNCTQIFTCNAGYSTSIKKYKAIPCDGRPQCANLEDECCDQCYQQDNFPEFCRHTSIYYNLFNFEGYRDFYSCGNGGIVITGPQVCDGFSRDCPGGEDELNCPGRIYCSSNDGDVQTEERIHRRAIHIDPTQKCDGKIDCENKSDEKNCSTHYYCEGGHPYFVPMRAVMDGKADCVDGSDECPSNSFNGSVFSSRKQMIKDPVLRYLIWVMGTLSIVGNLAVLMETIYGLAWSKNRFKNKRPFAKVNHVLVIHLALADLLMGIYLVILGSEAAGLSGNYCKEDKLWRSSGECSFLGALTVISSVTSVFILLILTSYRLYGVLKPFKCRDLNYTAALGFAGIAWMTSLVLAVLPLTTVSSSYKSHAWIKHNPYFRHDVVSKKALLEFVRKLPLFYHHDVQNKSTLFRPKSTDDSWESIKFVMTSLFGDDAIRGEFGYYSHVSVCMPQIYVTRNDAAWEHSMIIITFNCVAFTYIVAAYTYIFFRSVNTMKAKSNKRQRSMFRRISYLVASDLACWLPICVMAFMNFSGYKIPENAYAISAVILLPINSALNPLLYSNVVQKVFLYIVTCGERKKDNLHTSIKVVGNSCREVRLPDKKRLVVLSRETSLKADTKRGFKTEMTEQEKKIPDVVADSFSISGNDEELKPLKEYNTTSNF